MIEVRNLPTVFDLVVNEETCPLSFTQWANECVIDCLSVLLVCAFIEINIHYCRLLLFWMLRPTAS